MMKSLEDLEFTIFIPLILKDFLDSHCFTCLGDCSLEYDTE